MRACGDTWQSFKYREHAMDPQGIGSGHRESCDDHRQFFVFWFMLSGHVLSADEPIGTGFRDEKTQNNGSRHEFRRWAR